MSPPTGRYIPVSYFRRLVTDLMHFSAAVPSVTIERHMDLARLVAARQACSPPPTWSAIFTKAFALVAARTPLLRTSYMKFPWPRFYEHAINIVTLNVDRQLADERVVIYAHVSSPENHTLQSLDAIIRSYQEDPVESILSYRRAVRMSRIPWPFRRWIWWLGLNAFGSIRCHNFGTFGISSLGSQGAGITQLTPLLSSQLHFGMFDPSGGLEVRLSFDHRVLDGVTAALALGDLEGVLLGEMVRECTASAGSQSPNLSDDPCCGATNHER
jgi:hypothetical protein